MGSSAWIDDAFPCDGSCLVEVMSCGSFVICSLV